MSLIDKFKNFLRKQEKSSMQYNQRHEAFDKTTDGWGKHKDPMMDRIEDQ